MANLPVPSVIPSTPGPLAFPAAETPESHRHELDIPSSTNTNLVSALIRRWPWVLFGIIAGVVCGFLVNSRLPIRYQSTAQLLIMKNRADIADSTGRDVRLAYVGDYVETQLSLFRSHKLMRAAAQKLDRTGPFNIPVPPSEAERIALLSHGFSVSRDKEAGTATGNVLLVSFRSADPADAPVYLSAIIEAYRDELLALFEEATNRQLTRLDAEIEAMTNDWTKLETERRNLFRKSKELTQEDATGIGARVTANRTSTNELQLKKGGIERELSIISQAGKGRQERLSTLDRLGGRAERGASVASGPLEARSPEESMFSLQIQKEELSSTLGPNHPDILSIESKIRRLKSLLGTGAELDELDRYRMKLEAERDGIIESIKYLNGTLKDDEQKLAGLADIQEEIERRKISMNRIDDRIKEKRGEKVQVEATRLSGGYRVEDINPPTVGMQVAPVLMRSLSLGGILGLLAGLGLGMVIEVSDRSFRSPIEIRRRLGVPVVGHVPWINTTSPAQNSSKTGMDRTLAAFFRPGGLESEAYRGIRTQLYFSTQGRGHQVVQVTSPNPGDGKSTLAANLAISIAQSGKKVVLVDCDFRKPRIHKLFKVNAVDTGLASVVAGEATVMEATRSCEVEHLSLLPCGPRPSNPAELLTSLQFQKVLDELRRSYDFVIVDTPPILAVTDSSAVAPRVDGVLLVFRLTKNSRPAAEQARDALSAVGAEILGVVVNASSNRSHRYGGVYGAYRYGYYSDRYSADEVDGENEGEKTSPS